MLGDYRKFAVKMERESSAYRLWKRGADSAVCVVETYKNKRSVYFAVSNLLPSSALLREEDKEYHLILLGVDEGELIHRDFGPFYVNHQGEGSIFKKFTGPAIECYTHCLFVALKASGGGTETIYRGTMPFFKPREQAGEEEAGVRKGQTRNERFPENENGPGDENCPGNENGASHRKEGIEESSASEGGGRHEKGASQAIRQWQEIFERFYTEPTTDIFAEERDETQAAWCRVSQSSPLPQPLHGCRDLITTYGHYMIGQCGQRRFAAVPGRFLQREQPLREEGCFNLWQPLRGGEQYFEDLDSMPEALQEEIFGYWICGIEEESGALTAV